MTERLQIFLFIESALRTRSDVIDIRGQFNRVRSSMLAEWIGTERMLPQLHGAPSSPRRAIAALV